MILDNDGEMTEVQGSGKNPYILKNVGGVLSCSCPAWRNQSVTIDKRTCKHLKSVRGAAQEAARIGASAPTAPSPAPAAIPAPSGQAASRTAGYKKSAVGTIAAERLASGEKLRPDEKAKLYGPPILLADKIEDHPELDPTGWWQSEKLDGVRAYWNGKDFISREGNVYPAPAWFKAGLPDHPLDGELWMGRKKFQQTLSIVKAEGSGDRWKQITYVVFDLPHLDTPFEQRLFVSGAIWITEAKIAHPELRARIHEHVRCEGKEQLFAALEAIVAIDGEGLMLREPGSKYETCRSSTLIKVKLFEDTEAEVIAHNPGKGRHKGRMGSLTVKMPDGKTFELGTGFKDLDRRNPPPIGSIVTYKFSGKTDDGIPKCTSYLRPYGV